MTDSLHDAFGKLGQAPAAPPPGSAKHPEETDLIRQAKEILYDLPTGHALIDFMNSFKIPVAVLVGRDIDFFSPDNKSVVLTAPKNIGKQINELALGLASGLRVAQNYSRGFRPTTASHDTLEWKNEQAAKLLDIILLMCKITEEFKTVKNDTKFVDLIARLGHSDIYEAFLNKASDEELEKIMLKSINK